MLYRQEKQGKIAITQPMHAWLAGQLARAWGNERFGDVVPFEEVCSESRTTRALATLPGNRRLR